MILKMTNFDLTKLHEYNNKKTNNSKFNKM